jgi:tetratricopeptide (TPR) repeat protein
LPGWQALRTEVHPQGIEIVTVCLEVSGVDAARHYVDRAQPTHPSLIDVAHQLDAKFGVVNIPNAVWIDETGTIVRPAEPAWPGPTDMPRFEQPAEIVERLAKRPIRINAGGNRDRYPEAVRDWAARGSDSEFVLSADEVVARSQPRPPALSQGAAHFELAQHLWRGARRDGAIGHFQRAIDLQPDNWTYRRQAYSLISAEQAPGEFSRFVQAPVAGADWPFASDFWDDLDRVGDVEYYPSTM